MDEVCRNRGFQEQLAVPAPEDPRRLFGEVVEATAGGSQLTQILAVMNERITNQEKILATIQERFEQDRQRVNLNVRAPKRLTPHQPQITRDLAGVGRPYPVAKFLDSKEREDPSWKIARRSFAPAFSMQVQVLKKKKLMEEGRVAVYVEQNHRPQLLYTEEDRGLMEEAWELTTVTNYWDISSATHVPLCTLPLNLKWDQFGPTSVWISLTSTSVCGSLGRSKECQP